MRRPTHSLPSNSRNSSSRADRAIRLCGRSPMHPRGAWGSGLILWGDQGDQQHPDCLGLSLWDAGHLSRNQYSNTGSACLTGLPGISRYGGETPTVPCGNTQYSSFGKLPSGCTIGSRGALNYLVFFAALDPRPSAGAEGFLLPCNGSGQPSAVNRDQVRQLAILKV